MSEEKDKIETYDNIELRSEEVQEILGRPPRWIIRWGICVIFSVILTLLIGSAFFRYPDIITSEVTITTEHPAVWVVAYSTGKLQQLFVSDNQKITENELLAVIENPAIYTDITKLEEYLQSLKLFFIDYDINKLGVLTSDLQLGDIQGTYSQFYTLINDYIHFSGQEYHQKKIQSIRQELDSYNIYRKNLENQEKLQKENLDLIQKQFNRDTKLFESNTIALYDYENSEKQLLLAKQSHEQIKLSISNTDITIDKLKQNIVELELEYTDRIKTFRTSLNSNYSLLVANLNTWQQKYLLRGTTSGIVTFAGFWSQNQQINVGDKVFGIVAEQQGAIIGKVQLPSTGVGKVKVGQNVNIKLDGYPYMEYGMLPAKVVSISLVPNEKTYTVQLSLLQGMKTLYGEEIDFTGELNGIAEIATDEMTLFQRLLNPLKYFFKRNT